MAEEMICPKCERPSYTAAPYEPSPCPYCGFIFRKILSNIPNDDEDKGSQKGDKVK
jgi:hypothetical protein